MTVETWTVAIRDGEGQEDKSDRRHNFNKYPIYTKLIFAGLGRVWGLRTRRHDYITELNVCLSTYRIINDTDITSCGQEVTTASKSPFLRYLVPPRSKYSPQHHVLKHPQLNQLSNTTNLW
jgi:hypothetical protein